MLHGAKDHHIIGGAVPKPLIYAPAHHGVDYPHGYA